jgi:hypothetical protein
LLSRTIAVGLGVLSPTIASFDAPIPYLLLVGISLVGFTASTRLPKAGSHLPKIVIESDEVEPKIIEKQRNSEPLHTMLVEKRPFHVIPTTP